jgi:O-antigen ligase
MPLLFYDSIIGIATSILKRDVTLTGRSEIWRTLLDFASHNPVLGVGYGGFWVPGDRELEALFTPQFILSQAHNGYIAIYVELGIVGIVLLSAFLLAYCGRIQREINHAFDWSVYGICLLPMSLLWNTSEVNYLQSPNYLWSTMVFLTIVLSARCFHANEN